MTYDRYGGICEQSIAGKHNTSMSMHVQEGVYKEYDTSNFRNLNILLPFGHRALNICKPKHWYCQAHIWYAMRWEQNY